MKVLLINGSPNEKGCTYTALCEIAGQLEKNDIETQIFHIGNQPIKGCIGCKKCREIGKCAFDENRVNECIELINQSDGLILGSPVHYASIAGSFSAFLDRVFYAKKSFERKPAASVVSCRRAGSTAALDQLNKYFAISHMPIISSQYWNMVHGNNPEETKQDLEGMQTLRCLADNMAWFLKCIDYAKGQIPLPEKEERVWTGFIR